MATKHVILSSSSSESSYDSRAEDYKQRLSNPKKSKKKSYKCKYQKPWAAEFSIGPLNQIEHAFYGIHARKTFRVIIKAELMLWGTMTSQYTRILKSSRTMIIMFASASSAGDLVLNDQTLTEHTTRAELLHVNFIVQLNMPFVNQSFVALLSNYVSWLENS